MPNYLKEYQNQKPVVEETEITVAEEPAETEEQWWQRKYGQFERPERTMDTPTQRDAPPTGFDTPSPHPIPSNPPPAGNPGAHKPVKIQQSYDLGPEATLRTDERSAFRSPQLEDFYRRTGKKNGSR